MPVYFFDVLHGDTLTIDPDGSRLNGFDQARREAIEILPLIAREELPDGEQHVFSTTVYDENRKVVYVAKLTFQGERTGSV